MIIYEGYERAEAFLEEGGPEGAHTRELAIWQGGYHQCPERLPEGVEHRFKEAKLVMVDNTIKHASA